MANVSSPPLLVHPLAGIILPALHTLCPRLSDVIGNNRPCNYKIFAEVIRSSPTGSPLGTSCSTWRHFTGLHKQARKENEGRVCAGVP